MGVVELDHARFVATGDILMNGAVKDAAAGSGGDNAGYDPLWAGVSPWVGPADLAFANLEFPIEPEGGGQARNMVFFAPPVVLDSLSDLGFDVVSFANNHVYDQGRAGVDQTLSELERVGISAAGAGPSCDDAEAARWFDVGGLRTAVFARTIQLNDYLNGGRDETCTALWEDEQELVDKVRAARAEGAEWVMVSVHWGTEYAPAPSQAQRNVARRLVEAGVDVVLGHHPHVLQPIELVHATDGRTAVVAYSLGNFVSNQGAAYDPDRDVDAEGNPRDGVLLSITAARRRYAAEGGAVERVELVAVDPIVLWTNNDPLAVPSISVGAAEDQIARLERVGRAEEAEVLTRRLDGVRAALGPTVAPDGPPPAATPSERPAMLGVTGG